MTCGAGSEFLLEPDGDEDGMPFIRDIHEWLLDDDEEYGDFLPAPGWGKDLLT